jgi:hypothetical protein
MQKRRLLNFVVSNSTWANGELNANLREPFGLIAEMARFTSGGGLPNRANFANRIELCALRRIKKFVQSLMSLEALAPVPF